MIQTLKERLWLTFKNLGEDALVMSHYDLAKETDTPSEIWKDFLKEPDVSEWINQEMELIRDSEMKKLVKDINESKSVGQAQLMTALQKLSDKETTKSGPAFVYCYIPLNAEQKKAENVLNIGYDPFLKEK